MIVRGLPIIMLMGCLGCASDYTWVAEPNLTVGIVEIGLRKGVAIEIDNVSVMLTAPDDSTSTYEIDVIGADAASINVGGLTPGVYSVSFSAVTRQGEPCNGSAEFEVEPDLTTEVDVQVRCEVG